jgi:HEAT repeat protein
VTKTETYRAKLRSLRDWDPYLLKESGLPGPRGNLELAQVVADEGTEDRFRRYLTYTADRAPTNSPFEFLAFCGVVGLGRLLAEGDLDVMPTLRRFAADPRWRLREAVAMALQRQGDVDMARLLTEMRDWADGTPYEQRAAAAALCEPLLLGRASHARAVLRMLDRITNSVARSADRRSDAFLALRKGLGYCWSVAFAAFPEAAKPLMEKWIARPDPDVRWIMRENLKKNRMTRADAAWTKKWVGRLKP